MPVAGWVCEIDTGGACGQTGPFAPGRRRRREQMTDQKCNAAVSRARWNISGQQGHIGERRGNARCGRVPGVRSSDS